jgi:hypothetical protein
MGKIWEWITGGIGYLLGAVKLAAASIVARVLGAFGLSVVSINSILPDLQALVAQHTSGLTAEAASFLGAIGLGEAISMVLSALTIRMAFQVLIVPTSVADRLAGQ